MKKINILCMILFVANMTCTFGQFKVYNSKLVKFGDVNQAPTLKHGFETKMDTVLFNFIGGGILMYHVDPTLINNGTRIINPPQYHKMDYTVLRGKTNDDLQLGTSTQELRSIYSFDYYSSNATGISVISDSRYKTNIDSMPSALAKMLAVRPVKFDYIQRDSTESEALAAARKNKVGFIAQEIQEYIPEAVNYRAEDDIYTVDYTVLIPFLVKALQEQQEEIEKLKAALNSNK